MQIQATKQFRAPVPATKKSKQLMRYFGVDREILKTHRFVHTCRIGLNPGQICLITGPSGSGKTVLLNEIEKNCPGENRMRLDEIPLDSGKPLIDCINENLEISLHRLCRAGLSDVFTMLRPPAKLSLGQQIRYRLAKITEHPQQYIFADEFASILDRLSAKAAAFRLRKIARDTVKCFILATAHEDLIPDLQPDIIIYKHPSGTQIQFKPKPDG